MKSFSAITLMAAVSLGPNFSANAATGLSGKIIFLGTYGSGQVFIQLDAGPGISEPGCLVNARRIDIAGNHPQIKSILALAMAARASGQTFTGQVNGCLSAGSWPT